MAEDQLGQRKDTKASWTKIFTAFKVALDPKKLLLAAAGIVATAVGWWLLGWTFYAPRTMPTPGAYNVKDIPNDVTDLKALAEDPANRENWAKFKRARDRWNLLHEMAGDEPVAFDKADLVKSLDEFLIAKDPVRVDYKPFGRMRAWPWNEYRGANPYLLVTGNIQSPGLPGRSFVGWLLGDQLPVLVEPLVKFLSPILYMFDSRAGGWNRVYLILMILWTLFVWGFFGGAITRMAAVQLTRNEKISMREAINFAKSRCQSFFCAPLFPLIFLGILTLILIVFGLFSGLIPILGDILISGLLWPLVLILGMVMAVVLVGLVGWPLMNATISTEGSDSFDALSRSYSYVYQAPWQYVGYSFLAMLYGAVLVFFVGFMGSLVVYMGQWGVSQAPFLSSSDPARDREPTYLFVYAPKSFGWRDLLLHSSPFVEKKETTTPGGLRTYEYEMSKAYMSKMEWWNHIGAFLVNIWVYLLFMLVVGFGYSYFWTAATIIYLLMRRHVDDTDFDEVHMEEENLDEPLTQETTAPVPAPTPAVTMVEPPALRSASSLAETIAPPPAAEAPTPPPDGNPPPAN